MNMYLYAEEQIDLQNIFLGFTLENKTHVVSASEHNIQSQTLSSPLTYLEPIQQKTPVMVMKCTFYWSR
jgi:hypothetical protein